VTTTDGFINRRREAMAGKIRAKVVRMGKEWAIRLPKQVFELAGLGKTVMVVEG
jgi:hypothetical protein